MLTPHLRLSSGYRGHASAYCIHCFLEPLLMTPHTGNTQYLQHGLQKTSFHWLVPSPLQPIIASTCTVKGAANGTCFGGCASSIWRQPWSWMTESGTQYGLELRNPDYISLSGISDTPWKPCLLPVAPDAHLPDGKLLAVLTFPAFSAQLPQWTPK